MGTNYEKAEAGSFRVYNFSQFYKQLFKIQLIFS